MKNRYSLSFLRFTADGHMGADTEHSTAQEGGRRHEQRLFAGHGVAPGIAMGKAHVFVPRPEVEPGSTQETADGQPRSFDVEKEIQRFESAVQRSERELKKIIEFTREKLGVESADIFEAQRMMLHDEALYEAVIHEIKTDAHPAENAVANVMTQHRRRIEAGSNDFLRDRVSDLIDVQDRLHRNLRRGTLMESIRPGAIVVAERLAAADLVLFSRRGIQGCVIAQGGTTSHVAIIARSLGLPTIMGAREAVRALRDGDHVVVDARRGHVIVHPTARLKEAYQTQLQRHEERLKRQRHWRHTPAKTQDGHLVTLRANVEFTQEADLLEDCGAEGIGLFRTEMLLLISGMSSLSEEETYQTYRDVVQKARPYVTTLRLLDLGGDKLLPRAHREHNPFLGWRGVRVLLDRPELLRTQLRATLRAAVHGRLRILLPMVMDLEEVQTIRRVMNEVAEELAAAGVAHEAEVPLGIMVEIPSVALQADIYAGEVDFFSIGTNDLTQYTLAVDRGNDLIANRFSPYHPAVLGLIKKVVQEARKAGISVSVCGEMAGEPKAAPVLVGLGLDELSTSPAYLPEIKQAVRSFPRGEAQTMVDELLRLPSAAAVDEKLQQWIGEHAPDIDGLSGSEMVDEVLAS